MIQLVLLGAALVSVMLAGIVIANNYTKSANKTYSLLSMTAAVWLAANALAIQGPLTPQSPTLYLLVGRLITPSAIIVSFLLILFVLHFSHQEIRRYVKVLMLLSIPGLLITALSFTDWNVALSRDGVLLLGILSWPFALTVLTYLCIAAYFIFFKVHRNAGHDSYVVQTRYLRRAFPLAFLPAVFFGAVIPLFTDSNVSNLGPLFSIVFLLSAAWLIIRHRLFDIRPIVAKVIAYGMLLVTTVGVFSFFAIFVTQHTLGLTDGFVSQQFVPVALAIGLAIIFHPAKKFFDRITNKLFYQDAYDPQLFLNELNKTIIATIDTNKLLQEVERVIELHIKSSYTIFVVHGTQKHLIESMENMVSAKKLDEISGIIARFPDAITFVDDLGEKPGHMSEHKWLATKKIGVIARLETSPIDDHQGKIGFMLLGDKKSGSPYSSQDRRILEIVVGELAIAIQNSLRFEEIQRFNETLQQKIVSATHRLQSTNDKLRRLDQTKDDFISMASHQLRTPLTSIKGYISMVLEGDAGEVSPLQKKLLSQAFVSSQRMVYLISDLLNVSRLRTGKFIIEPTPTHLVAIAREEVSQLQETAKSRGIELSVAHTDHFPALMLDETKMRQVVMNFIDNAIYYTPEGGHISVNVIEKPHSVELTVVDDGMGVPKGDQPRLFTKFFRANNAKRARPDGTGLGLFMAKKVVMAQGGAIIFKSQEGKGSTFGFTFAKDKVTIVPHYKPVKKEPSSLLHKPKSAIMS